MNDRFDSLARRLGARLDRRRVATVAAGGALGAVGWSAFREEAAAKKCKHNDDCPDGKKCRHKKEGRGRCS